MNVIIKFKELKIRGVESIDELKKQMFDYMKGERLIEIESITEE